MGTCISFLKKNSVKEKKNTRRRLSISTKIDLPDDTEEIKRSIQELKHNEDKFKESSENVTTRRISENEVQEVVEGEENEEEEERRKKLDKKKRSLKNRSSVAGVRASHFQEDFEKKCVKIKGSVEKLHENGIGYVCRKGLKPESPNQDDFIIITMENLALYAIFDGHGPYGHDVSNYVQKELPYMIIKNENFLKNPKEVFTKAFLNIHENIERTTNAYLDSFTNKNSNNKLHLNSNFVINDQALESMQGYNNYTDSDTNSDDSYDYDDTIEDDEDDEEDDEEDESNDNKDDDHEEEEEEGESNSSIDDEFNKENKKTKKENDPDVKEEKSLTTRKKKQKKKKMKKRKKRKNKIFFDSTMSGTTATIIVHLFKEKKLYVAYVGDSRAVLGKRKNGSKQLSAVELTKDHKPNCAAEKKRILSSGGQVMKLEGDIPYRVFIKNKFYPGLAMSRAIGDTIGHQIGIIAEPDFIEVNINEDEDILVLICSDGVWEFISSEEAVNLIYEFGYNNVQDAVENLARESWDRWLNEEENIVDDITIQAIYLSEKSKYLK
ncbi:hypothetical protein PFHG_05055 [Plasmodium falciparum HB3]|uniref:Protein phosphatase PPM5, putative n=4 Tax=Plasmodium falciparum TaxID=5833 RepID=C0H4T6_PLAF7|nr:protein phosphatase PPM5, putative [Plasmodium falciparum 3D7]ETW43242.1 hypothetical protein, variant [Plasmodium falciparum NF135/5.C10]KAF4330305.1 protein phosphatase PPM5 [Plasmodium falciparum NF54]KOB63265.1 hypothetical protein PFHG_05055 [Plasmodium falciparum HB3]PKC47396.1 protein phosphatase PPM5 [Plasmodium falciparum NF54]CAX64112.1 protein phosphatase PPM5, putative [Plasmodium falciparum 3D7]|eukprot:XP_002808835.1 protein phosphatase PPM5, putative [Plasmodium falciparum 3D7]